MWFFSLQPETFNSIFFINSWEVYNYPVILLITILFIVLIVISLVMKKYWSRYGLGLILFIIIFCWTLSFANLFYNSWYDVADNFEVRGLTMEKKRLERIYNFERSQGLGYTYYDVLSLMPQVKEIIPEGSKLLCLIPYVLNPYFYYNLYPDYPAVTRIDEIEYVLFYSPLGSYQYSDNQHLYQINPDNTLEDFGKYEIIKMFDNNKIIFKRLK